MSSSRPFSSPGAVAVLLLLALSPAFAEAGGGKGKASSRPAAKTSPNPRPSTLSPGSIRVLRDESPRDTGEPISLDLKEADIRDVLLTFSKLTRISMVIDPEVKGTVTVRLENVPWDQALDVILKVNGLGYVLEGNVLQVGTPQKLQRP